MSKIVEIFTAWGIALNPNDLQNELAVKRMEICEECEFKKSIPINRCGACGCPLRGKVFTTNTYLSQGGSCPKNKWRNVERDWIEKKDKIRYDTLNNSK